MARKTPEVRQHPKKGRGWAVILIPGVKSPPERFDFAIQDNANAKWFSDDGNWVASQVELLPREWAHKNETLELTVGPDIVNRLLPQPVWLIMSQVDAREKMRWPKLDPSSAGTAPPQKQREQPGRGHSISDDDDDGSGGTTTSPWGRGSLLAAALGLFLAGAIVGAVITELLLADPDSRIADLQNRVEALTQERDRARADLADAQDRADRLQARLDGADGADPEAQDLRDRIAELEQDLSDARARADRVAAERDDATQQLAAAEEETDKLREELAAAQDRIQALERKAGDAPDPQALADAQAQADRLRDRLSAAQDRIRALEDQAGDAPDAAALADARDEADRLRGELDTANRRISELERQLADRPEAQQLDDARTATKQLRDKLDAATQRIAELEGQLRNSDPDQSAVARVFSQHRNHLVSEIGVTSTILPRLRQRIENGESVTRAVRRIYGSRDNGLAEFLCEKLPEQCS